MTSQETALWTAVVQGRLSLVKQLIEKEGVDSGFTRKAGRTLLHTAAFLGHTSVVKYLVKSCGANVDRQDMHGLRPLDGAAQQGRVDTVKFLVGSCRAYQGASKDDMLPPLLLAARHGHLNVVKWLYSHGKSEFRIYADQYGHRPVHLAAAYNHANVVRWLLRRDQRCISVPDQQDRLPLHLAAASGSLDVVKILAAADASHLSRFDKHGYTPVHAAIQHDHINTLTYLDGVGAPFSLNTTAGLSCLHVAAQAGALAVLRWLLVQREFVSAVYVNSHVQATGDTPLHTAAAAGCLDVVLWLINVVGADLEAVNHAAMSPLDAAVATQPHVVAALLPLYRTAVSHHDAVFHAAMLHAIKAGSLDSVKVLVTLGAVDPSSACPTLRLHGRFVGTPLLAACNEGYVSIVRYFVQEHTLNLDCSPHRALPPLHAAAAAGSLDVVAFLIENCEMIEHLRDENLATALHVAVQHDRMPVVAMLVSVPTVDVHVQRLDGQTPLALAITCKHEEIALYLVAHASASIDIRDQDGKTALYLAVERDMLSVAMAMVERSGHVDVHAAATSSGETPLFLATKRGHDALVAAMLQHGPPPEDSADRVGMSLHAAAAASDLDAIKYRLALGDDVEAGDETDGMTPVQLAVRYGRSRALQFLHTTGKADLTVVAEQQHRRQLHHLAAAAASLHCMVYLLDHGDFDINAPDQAGYTPLMIAAEAGSLDVVQLLERRDADISRRDQHGRTGLHLACIKGRVNVAKHLAARLSSALDAHGYTAFHLGAAGNSGAWDAGKAVHAMAAAADDVGDYVGLAPVHQAVRDHALDKLKYLLEHCEADVNRRDNGAATPLHTAAASGDRACIVYLFSIAELDTTAAVAEGSTALHVACLCHNMQFLRLALDGEHPSLLSALQARDASGETPLHVCARVNHLDMVQVLVRSGKVSLQISDKHGWTPLALAAHTGNPDVVDWLAGKAPKLVNVADKNACTPLDAAIEGRHFGVVSCLIKRGANVNVLGATGLTPLHRAVASGLVVMVEALVAAGARADIHGSSRSTALHLAAGKKHIGMVKLLVSEGCGDVAQRDDTGRCALHCAVEGTNHAASLVVTKWLIEEAAADVTAETKHGKSVMRCAVEGGNAAVAEYLVKHERANLHVAWGATTALHLAVELGHLTMVQMFVQRCNADVNMKSQAGFTPLEVLLKQRRGVRVRSVVLKASFDGLELGNEDPGVKIARCLVEAGADVNMSVATNLPLLHDRVLADDAQVLQVLLTARGVNVHVRGTTGDTLLMACVRGGETFMPCIKTLVEDFRVDVNATNSNGTQGAVDISVEKGYSLITQFLVHSGGESHAPPDSDTLGLTRLSIISQIVDVITDFGVIISVLSEVSLSTSFYRGIFVPLYGSFLLSWGILIGLIPFLRGQAARRALWEAKRGHLISYKIYAVFESVIEVLVLYAVAHGRRFNGLDYVFLTFTAILLTVDIVFIARAASEARHWTLIAGFVGMTVTIVAVSIASRYISHPWISFALLAAAYIMATGWACVLLVADHPATQYAFTGIKKGEKLFTHPAVRRCYLLMSAPLFIPFYWISRFSAVVTSEDDDTAPDLDNDDDDEWIQRQQKQQAPPVPAINPDTRDVVRATIVSQAMDMIIAVVVFFAALTSITWRAGWYYGFFIPITASYLLLWSILIGAVPFLRGQEARDALWSADPHHHRLHKVYAGFQGAVQVLVLYAMAQNRPLNGLDFLFLICTMLLVYFDIVFVMQAAWQEQHRKLVGAFVAMNVGIGVVAIASRYIRQEWLSFLLVASAYVLATAWACLLLVPDHPATQFPWTGITAGEPLFEHPNIYTVYLVMAAPLLVPLYWRRRHRLAVLAAEHRNRRNNHPVADVEAGEAKVSNNARVASEPPPPPYSPPRQPHRRSSGGGGGSKSSGRSLRSRSRSRLSRGSTSRGSRRGSSSHGSRRGSSSHGSRPGSLVVV